MNSPAVAAIRRLRAATKTEEVPRPVHVPAFTYQTPPPSADEVAEMALEDFAAAGLVVTVRSRLLEEEVLFVSDDVNDPEDGRVVYRVAELRSLAGAAPEDVKRAHRLKAHFGGTFEKGAPT